MNLIQPMPRTRMWRVARTMQHFTIEDLHIVGETTRAEASAFLKCILRRGFAQQEGTEARPRRGRPLAKFRLINNPGPKLPLELRGKDERSAA